MEALEAVEPVQTLQSHVRAGKAQSRSLQSLRSIQSFLVEPELGKAPPGLELCLVLGAAARLDACVAGWLNTLATLTCPGATATTSLAIAAIASRTKQAQSQSGVDANLLAVAPC